LILLTLGTHEQPFDRAIDMVAGLGGAQAVLVQHGHTAPRPGLAGFEWVKFVERERMRELVAEASTVICHAGVGCIVTAVTLGKTPVVIPRLARFGEHVDDHQLQITTEMETAGMVVACVDAAALPGAVEAARTRKAVLPGRGDLRQAVREATAEALRRPPKLSLRSVVAGARAR
jgi:UDP-N-acetylglucosamine transferase subunit ALG13